MSYSIAIPASNAEMLEIAPIFDRYGIDPLQNQNACIFWNEEGPEPMRPSGPRFSLVAIALPKCV
jgi:hypothetical protein